MEPQSAGSPTSPSSPGAQSPELPKPPAQTPPSTEETPEEAAVKPDRQSSSSSSSSSRASSAGYLLHLDAAELSTPVVVAAPDDDDHADAAPGDGAEAKPDDWASWPEQLPPTVEDPFLSDGGTQAPQAQTMAMLAPAPADNGFNLERIPASIFQTKSSSSQAEWSIASNESLFSIHGASQSDDLGGLYASNRSHFDYFYDEAMAATGGGEPDWKLPPLAEGSEPADYAVPGSAGSDTSATSARAKMAMAFRRHESGSIGSSSNLSFSFPILAETSPRKESACGYYQLRKEYEQPSPRPDPASAFGEMSTEERRSKTGWCWCGDCCGCCLFACSWSSCCACCQWRWLCCSCSCPSWCRCNLCLCF